MFADVAQAILEETGIIQNVKYLKEVLNFLRNLLVNFYPSFLDRESFARVIDAVFNVNATIYNRIPEDMLDEINTDAE